MSDFSPQAEMSDMQPAPTTADCTSALGVDFMTRKQKKTLIRIIAAAILLIVVSLLPDQIYPGERWVIDLTGEWAPPADWVETGYTAYVYGGLGLKFLMYFVE